MKKVAMIIARIPNPRTLKRIKVLEDNFSISLLYWDRDLKVKETFEINEKNEVAQILVKAPQGRPLARIIPLTRFFYFCINELKSISPDIIHAENLDMLLIAYIYKKIYNHNTKIVYEVADLPKYSFYRKINSVKALISIGLQYLEKKLIKSISKLILTSPYFWDKYFSKFVGEDKYLFIPNAPYKELFSKYTKKSHENFTIGFIGSVRYVEQLKMLIDAIDELDKGIKLFVAGSGPGYKEILDYSKDKTFVEIYGPYNYEKEVVELYERVDCIYSVYDTKLHNVRIALPNRLYESIVCEIPIIGAKGTVLGKFIEDNKIGFTVNSNDKEELKNKLLSLIESEKKLNYYQENCKEIKKDYYYENNSKKLLIEYKKI